MLWLIECFCTLTTLTCFSVEFVHHIFLDRERTSEPVWFFNPSESHRLTDDDISDFVNCVKDCAFISIFNKDYLDIAADACHFLSQLRPDLIIPPLVEQFVNEKNGASYHFLICSFFCSGFFQRSTILLNLIVLHRS